MIPPYGYASSYASARGGLERAQRRLGYAQRELQRAEVNVDPLDPRTPHALRKLRDDVRKAEEDTAHAAAEVQRLEQRASTAFKE